jgi:two-component system response regulator RegA
VTNANESSENRDPRSGRTPPDRDEGPTILVVDDVPIAAKSIAGVMRFVNRNVLEATNYEEVLALTAGIRIDVAVVDLVMGPPDGIDVCVHLKTIRPDTHTLLVSAFFTNHRVFDAGRSLVVDEVCDKGALTREMLRYLAVHGALPDPGEYKPRTLDKIENEYIDRILAANKGNITRAADDLGMHRQSLQRILRRRREG